VVAEDAVGCLGERDEHGRTVLSNALHAGATAAAKFLLDGLCGMGLNTDLCETSVGIHVDHIYMCDR
jgi:hypothetical protein